MNLFKFAAGLASGAVLLLFSLAMTLQPPEAAAYASTTQQLMEIEQLHSIEELEACFPELTDIRADIVRMAALKQALKDQAQHPAPQSSESIALGMEVHHQELQYLQHGVQNALNLLLSLYAEGRL